MSKVSNHLDCLGHPVTERVTGFSGVLTAVSFDLYGCIQGAVTPAVDKDGKLVDGRWFDIQRLKMDTTKRVMSPPPTIGQADVYLDHLGYPGADRVTEFSGICASVVFDLYGIVQAVLSPPVDKEGKLNDGRGFDIQRLEWDRSQQRSMPLPAWAAKPAEHTHGPAEKPADVLR